jgi:hypothetical protein
MHAILKAIVEIGVEVAIIDRGKPVSTLDDPLDGPPPRLSAARRLRRAVVDDPDVCVVLHPLSRKRDAGIGMDRMVAPEIQPQEQRDRR